MVTEHAARRLAAEWIDAWNRHDLEAILAHYAEDATLVSPLAVARGFDPTGTVRGNERLRDYFAEGLRRRPDLRFEVERVLVGVDGLALAYRRERGARVVECLVLDGNGKVREARVHYDPPPDGRRDS